MNQGLAEVVQDVLDKAAAQNQARDAARDCG
jgi:hypothetical protein